MKKIVHKPAAPLYAAAAAWVLYALPVSYTHLDVYKRQALDAPVVGEPLLVEVLGPEDVGGGDGAVIVGVAGSADGIHPVSYTHLDVYKRQARYRARWLSSPVLTPGCSGL